ncbi:hypothetical protein HZB01_04125 [Candidatus Woesearchaeota archaeon]|nr:hypothetical protein [Candidatus Woesearchaeota archaeon]
MTMIDFKEQMHAMLRILHEMQKSPPLKKNLFYGKEQKQDFHRRELAKSLANLQTGVWDLYPLLKEQPAKETYLREMQEIMQNIQEHLQNKEFPDIEKGLDRLLVCYAAVVPGKNAFRFAIPPLPVAIREDVVLDMEEMQRCFEHSCFRSAMILCGRILEIALYRKYYETTNTDLMETAPNLGLGKIIAKLREANVSFDPGTNEQIHLINQMRVSSVHTKKENFMPTREQTHAVILYTIDVLKKLFGTQTGKS